MVSQPRTSFLTDEHVLDSALNLSISGVCVFVFHLLCSVGKLICAPDMQDCFRCSREPGWEKEGTKRRLWKVYADELRLSMR